MHDHHVRNVSGHVQHMMPGLSEQSNVMVKRMLHLTKMRQYLMQFLFMTEWEIEEQIVQVLPGDLQTLHTEIQDFGIQQGAEPEKLSWSVMLPGQRAVLSLR